MKRSGKNSRIGVAVGVALGFALAGACESQSSSRVGGETHWLDACDHDADCERGGCLCGVCTEPCGGDDSCTGETRQAGCFAVASPGLVDRCGETVKAHGVCLALCAKDADCPTGDQCHLGACVSRTASGGDASTAEVDPPLPHASDVADVDAATDFSNPVVLPEPSTTIRDATDAFLGTWSEVKFDGQACNHGPDACVNLELTKSAHGIVGSVYLVRFRPSTALIPLGPFAAPSDPSVGYPAEVSPDNYWDLANGLTVGTRYRLLDGVVVGGELSFFYSYVDLWNDWCRLQTPHPVGIHGTQEFRCVDSSADETNTDLGQLQLCRAATDEEQCLTKGGVWYPCKCIGADGDTPSFACIPVDACSCTATSCSTNVRAHGAITRVKLSLEAGVLKGTWVGPVDDPSPIELRKVTP